MAWWKVLANTEMKYSVPRIWGIEKQLLEFQAELCSRIEKCSNLNGTKLKSKK
jgi:hypothetical protein